MNTTIRYSALFTAVLLIAQPLLAGDKGEHENWMRQAKEKEMRRANEAAENNGNGEHMEKKYGWLKENHPAEYADMMARRAAASAAWKKAAADIATAETYEDINASKTAAYQADAHAELARLKLKAAGAKAGWLHSAEKTGSPAVAALAQKLIQNQDTILKATENKMAAQQLLHQLETQRAELEKQMRTEYESAKRAMHTPPKAK